jgi:biopolymer transport protein ExbD
MLLTRQKQQQTGPQLNMAAMVDVVFLLLIFFMCTSSISQLESSLSSQVSRLGPGSGQELEELPPYIVRLERAGEGVLVWLEDRPCATFDDLYDRLREAPRDIQPRSGRPGTHKISGARTLRIRGRRFGCLSQSRFPDCGIFDER